MNTSVTGAATHGGLQCNITDMFGWFLQIILAAIAFTCLILKRFCEPRYERRPWLIWFYDTSKQGMGALVIHLANVYLATNFQGDPCTWYIINFLLDSSVGLGIIYVGIRVSQYLSRVKQWEAINFGEYGKPPSVNAWLAQCCLYVLLMVIVKICITVLIQFDFWDDVRDFILSPVTNPKVEVVVVMLIIPFFINHKIDCVIHFAAMKAVGESMQVPLLYYKNNIVGTINLLEVMKTHGCCQLVFSSSCTVYGNPEVLPITEEHQTGNVTNVYGRTKYFIEEMLKDISAAEKNWNIICLRYFNPVGAHPSGLIGEDPTKAFTNLMPYMAQVAIGNRPSLTIFGGDYDTVDGTGVRDYIHVMDLASGHVAALNKLKKEHLRLKTYNLGTGQGVSVLQLLRTFEAVTNTVVPFEIQDRRNGDIVSMYAKTALAERELGWKAKYTLEQMCEDFWRWQTMNPDGYRGTNSSSASRTSVIVNGSHLNGH